VEWGGEMRKQCCGAKGNSPSSVYVWQVAPVANPLEMKRYWPFEEGGACTRENTKVTECMIAREMTHELQIPSIRGPNALTCGSSPCGGFC